MHGQKNEGSNDPTKGLPRFSKHSQRPSTIQQSSAGDIDTFTHRPFYTQTLFPLLSSSARKIWAPSSSAIPRVFLITVPHRSSQTALHRNTFTHEVSTQRRFYSETLWHAEPVTRHTNALHTDAFTHRSLYTQTLLHTHISTEKHFYTQTLVQTNIFTQRFFLCALCSVCCIWELCTTESNFSLLAASPQQPIRLLRLGGLSQKYYMANLRNFVVSRW